MQLVFPLSPALLRVCTDSWFLYIPRQLEGRRPPSGEQRRVEVRGPSAVSGPVSPAWSHLPVLTHLTFQRQEHIPCTDPPFLPYQPEAHCRVPGWILKEATVGLEAAHSIDWAPARGRKASYREWGRPHLDMPALSRLLAPWRRCAGKVGGVAPRGAVWSSV